MLPLWEEDLKRHCEAFKKHFSPHAPAFIIINDYQEEKQVEKKITETKPKIKQPVEVEQLTNFCQHQLKEDYWTWNLIPMTYLLLYLLKHGPSS